MITREQFKARNPWWKRTANSLLRVVQPWPHKWVIYTSISTSGDDRVLGYGFGRVLHLSGGTS